MGQQHKKHNLDKHHDIFSRWLNYNKELPFMIINMVQS
jgi:hypothetical protein